MNEKYENEFSSDDIFGEEEFDSSFSDDIFGKEEFDDELLSNDIFGEEEFGDNKESSNSVNKSNMYMWLNSEGNRELINMGCTNPNDRIFFRNENFNYDLDYSDLRFIFERFRSDLLEGE